METQSYLTELAPADRIDALRDTADKIEQTRYFRKLTPEELDIKREELSETAIKLSDIQNEMKETNDKFKERMKPLKDSLTGLIYEVKTKQAECEGIVYHLANHDTGMMESYDDKGDLIGSRRLRPEERQSNLFVNAQK